MNTNRHARPPYAGQKGRCAWCGTTDIPKGRRTWCSNECVEAYKMRSHPEFVRQKVHERDKGICAICGIDCDAAYFAWREAMREVRRLAEWLISRARFDNVWINGRWERKHPAATGMPTFPQKYWQECARYRDQIRAKYAPPGRWTSGRRSGWDADHIVPVAEGGGECDLSNYRTLCHGCHKDQTAALARRLADRRNPTPRLL